MRNIYLIFRRDYLGYVKAWGFWLGLASLPVFMLIGAGIMGLVMGSAPVRYYSVIEADGRVAAAIRAGIEKEEQAEIEGSLETASMIGVAVPDPDELRAKMIEERRFVEVPPPAKTLDAVKPYLLGEKLVRGPEGEKPLFAVFVRSADGRDVEYWSEDVSVSSLRDYAASGLKDQKRREALSAAGLSETFLDETDESTASVLPRRVRPPGQEQKGQTAEVTLADRAPDIVVVVMAYFLWLMIFSVIQYLLMGTIEERSNKIFDTLLTSVRVPELLAGKLLAVLGVTSTMMLVWGGFGLFSSTFLAAQSDEFAGLLSPFLSTLLNMKFLLPALISFVLGYLLYGALFLALGALCDTIQEAQTLLSPMMLLLMVPMVGIIIAFQNPGSPIVDALSWVPVFTPFLLILRMAGDPPLWEVIAQIALMAVTTLIIVWIAAKIYRAGAVNGASAGDIGGMFRRLFGGKTGPAAK